MNPFTALVIPVREAELLVRAKALAAGSGLQPRDGSVMAHITLLAPFVPEPEIDDHLLVRLRDFFREVEPIRFRLTSVAEFPDGAVYLTPEPASWFRELVDDLEPMFPELGLRHGRFEEVVPHLTVDLPDGQDRSSLEHELEARLPIEATVREATVVRAALHDVRSLATFGFGWTAA